MDRYPVHTLASRFPPAIGGAGIVVCERRGTWAAALRRELGPALPPLEEVRSLDAAEIAIARTLRCVAVVEMTATTAETVLPWLATVARSYPLTRLAVVAPRELAACEDAVREAGAVVLATSPRRLEALAVVALRHLTAGTQRTNLADAVWASLPWATSAADGGDRP